MANVPAIVITSPCSMLTDLPLPVSCGKWGPPFAVTILMGRRGGYILVYSLQFTNIPLRCNPLVLLDKSLFIEIIEIYIDIYIYHCPKDSLYGYLLSSLYMYPYICLYVLERH